MSDELLSSLNGHHPQPAPARPATPRAAPTKRVTVENIIRMVCDGEGMERSVVLSGIRTAGAVRVRYIAMYLARTLTGRSLPDIGRRFDGRDHTTVLHGVRKMEKRRDTDYVLDATISRYENRIKLDYLTRAPAPPRGTGSVIIPPPDSDDVDVVGEAAGPLPA